jgi:hypothetical protein
VFCSFFLYLPQKERAPAGTFVACIVVMWRINCGFVSALIKEQYQFLGCIALASATQKSPPANIFSERAFSLLAICSRLPSFSLSLFLFAARLV